jgi:hypothetical protein
MSIQVTYRRVPDYFVVPLVLLASAVAALICALFAAYSLNFLLGKVFQNQDALGYAITSFFLAAPGLAILAFVFCFSVAINWHHPTSWRSPTLAFALGAMLVWTWARGFGGIGFLWYLPGAVSWAASCWILHRKSNSHSDHIIEA